MRGYKEEGTTRTPFDMVVMNDLDRFHLFGDVVDRLPQLGSRAAYAKQAISDKLFEHKQYIAKYGEDMPEITDWQWGQRKMETRRRTSTEARRPCRQRLKDGPRLSGSERVGGEVREGWSAESFFSAQGAMRKQPSVHSRSTCERRYCSHDGSGDKESHVGEDAASLNHIAEVVWNRIT